MNTEQQIQSFRDTYAALRAEIGKTRRVKGNVLDAVEPAGGKGNAEDAAKLIKGI